MFMLLHGADHGRCTPPRGGSDRVGAQRGRRTRQSEISLHSGSLQSSSMAMAINMLNKSILNAESNGVVLMNG